MPKTKTTKSTQKGMLYKVMEPKIYNVIMHNDEVTTMDFVVSVLVNIFNKSEATAESLMMKIHNEGMAVVGSYSLDIAETKAHYAMMAAKDNGFPLRITVEVA